MTRILLFLPLFLGCGKKVQRLDPRDARLPTEAGRWLADAEDEVAISNARVDDAATELGAHRVYSRQLLRRLNATGGQAVANAFKDWFELRNTLLEYELESARAKLALSQARLVQARAEMAVRYDLAAYDLEPINASVEAVLERVATAERAAVQTRAQVEKLGDAAWANYAQYVAGGGDTVALWDPKQGER